MRKESFPKGTAVEVAVLPDCDICKVNCREHGLPDSLINKAQYDAATTMGPWANLCEHHYGGFGRGLGTGLGQRLLLVEKETFPNEGVDSFAVPARDPERGLEICADCERESVIRFVVKVGNDDDNPAAAEYGFCAYHADEAIRNGEVVTR
jgi:hypothetical protein